jgi:hypothetical protein
MKISIDTLELEQDLNFVRNLYILCPSAISSAMIAEVGVCVVERVNILRPSPSALIGNDL